MDNDVQFGVKECLLCQHYDKTAKVYTAPLQLVPLPKGQWQKVEIYIAGPFDRAPKECRFAVTLMDYYTKWSEMAFTASVTTKDITDIPSTVAGKSY